MISKGRGGEDTSGRVKPFLKWPGGKRWLWPALRPLLPIGFGRYFEPFLGGGAIFFALLPKRSILSDINPEVVNAYIQIRDNVDGVIRRLSSLRVNRRTYDRVRRLDPRDRIDRAVRLIYLSKTAFNGMYRVNRQGLFNVPFAGQQNRRVLEPEVLRAASFGLQHAEMRVRDFGDSLNEAEAGDLVYCDPPYTVLHNNNGFIRYNENIFSWGDQERLAELSKEAASRGVCVIVSNAQTNHVRALYGGFKAVPVWRSSCVSAVSSARGRAGEFLFISKM